MKKPDWFQVWIRGANLLCVLIVKFSQKHPPPSHPKFYVHEGKIENFMVTMKRRDIKILYFICNSPSRVYSGNKNEWECLICKFLQTVRFQQDSRMQRKIFVG